MIPTALLELQQWVGKIVTRPLRAVDERKMPLYDAATLLEIDKRVTAGPVLSAAERIGIHNQQYWFRLFTLLQQKYPTLLRLFGYYDFNHQIAQSYFLKYPVNHWLLDRLGERLPQWVFEEYVAEDRDLVHQVALVDEAYEGKGKRLLTLDGDFFALRTALLPRAVGEGDFPKVTWFDTPRHYSVEHLNGQVIVKTMYTQTK